MSNQAKFEFFEIVIASPERACDVSGERGVVLGRTPTDDGPWYYTVYFEKTKCTWALFEREMMGTGERDESFKSIRGNIRLAVDERIAGAE